MDKVKHIREQLNLSQNQLAKALGISFSTISRWETGLSSPNETQMDQIETLQDLLNNKEIDTAKLKRSLASIGIMGSIFAAVAAGIALKSVPGGIIAGFIAKQTGGALGAAISGEDISKLLKKDPESD